MKESIKINLEMDLEFDIIKESEDNIEMVDKTIEYLQKAFKLYAYQMKSELCELEMQSDDEVKIKTNGKIFVDGKDVEL